MDSTMFLDVSLKLSDYDKTTGYDLGLRIGTFITPNFSLSFGMNYLLSQDIFIGNKGEFLTLWYGGLTPEFVLKTGVIPGLYLHANSYIGAGYADFNEQTNMEVIKPMSGEWFVFAEPSVGLYQQITKDIVIGASVGKRIASNIGLKSLEQKTFQGALGLITLRVLIYQE